MYPKDKIPSQLKQSIVYKWLCSEENCNLSYSGESSRSLEYRIKEHNSHITSTFYQHSISNIYPRVNISHFKIIDQDGIQITWEAWETIHIRINNTTLNHNTGKCTSWKSSTTFLEEMDLLISLTERETQIAHNVTLALPFQAASFPDQCVWQIK